MRFDSTIHVVDAARVKEEGELPGKARRRSRARGTGRGPPVKRQFPSRPPRSPRGAEPRAPAPAEPDDDWRARTRLVRTPQGPRSTPLIHATFSRRGGSFYLHSGAVPPRGRRVGRRDRD